VLRARVGWAAPFGVAGPVAAGALAFALQRSNVAAGEADGGRAFRAALVAAFALALVVLLFEMVFGLAAWSDDLRASVPSSVSVSDRIVMLGDAVAARGARRVVRIADALATLLPLLTAAFVAAPRPRKLVGGSIAGACATLACGAIVVSLEVARARVLAHAVDDDAALVARSGVDLPAAGPGALGYATHVRTVALKPGGAVAVLDTGDSPEDYELRMETGDWPDDVAVVFADRRVPFPVLVDRMVSAPAVRATTHLMAMLTPGPSPRPLGELALLTAPCAQGYAVDLATTADPDRLEPPSGSGGMGDTQVVGPPTKKKIAILVQGDSAKVGIVPRVPETIADLLKTDWNTEVEPVSMAPEARAARIAVLERLRKTPADTVILAPAPTDDVGRVTTWLDDVATVANEHGERPLRAVLTTDAVGVAKLLEPNIVAPPAKDK
jgi:hypothetical protein